jgi:hypothetical protein
VLRNGEDLGFLFRRRPAGHARGFGVGTNARKMANGGNGSKLVRSREGKMEIPAELSNMSTSDQPLYDDRATFTRSLGRTG